MPPSRPSFHALCILVCCWHLNISCDNSRYCQYFIKQKQVCFSSLLCYLFIYHPARSEDKVWKEIFFFFFWLMRVWQREGWNKPEAEWKSLNQVAGNQPFPDVAGEPPKGNFVVNRRWWRSTLGIMGSLMSSAYVLHCWLACCKWYSETLPQWHRWGFSGIGRWVSEVKNRHDIRGCVDSRLSPVKFTSPF